MPHFILDCSSNIAKMQKPALILEAVFLAAEESGLFVKGDIKVRLNPFQYCSVGGVDADFIHVFANIMQGRTDLQKAELSYRIVQALNLLFPDVPVISMNVRDFEKASYINKTML